MKKKIKATIIATIIITIFFIIIKFLIFGSDTIFIADYMPPIDPSITSIEEDFYQKAISYTKK